MALNTSAKESAAAQKRPNAAFVLKTKSKLTAPPTTPTNCHKTRRQSNCLYGNKKKKLTCDADDTEFHSHGAVTVLAAMDTCVYW